jgi:hypothetical protein
VELFTQTAHFCFQVVQVFLVTTISSAASAATAQIIQDPLSAKDLLAENLPKATNFYISYFLLQGLTTSSLAVVQIMSVLVFKLITTFFDGSPRRLYSQWAALSAISWGNVFPIFTNMGVIGAQTHPPLPLPLLGTIPITQPCLLTTPHSSPNILLHRTLDPRLLLRRPVPRLPSLPL